MVSRKHARSALLPTLAFAAFAIIYVAAWYLLAVSPLVRNSVAWRDIAGAASLFCGLALALGVSLLWFRAQAAAVQLALSEQRFRDFAEAAGDWFWETGPDHRFTFMSRRAATDAAGDSPP